MRLKCIPQNNFEILGTAQGVLNHMFTRSEFNPCIEKFILLENLSDFIKNNNIFFREVAAANCIVTVWAYYARYLLNEHSIRDGSDAPQYLAGRVLK